MRTHRADLDGLLAFALATFHASLFLLAFLLFLYWQDVLRHVLPGLNTLLGLVLFMVLWACTWYTTRRALRDLEADDALLGRAARWGGVNGVLFLLTLAAGQLVATVVLAPQALPGALLFSAFLAVVGSIVAFGIGGVVGLVLASIDLALLAVARRLARGVS